MMSSRIGWSAVAALGYAAALAVLYGDSAWSAREPLWRWAHALVYGGVGIVLLGALARNLPHAQPQLWRVLTLIVGAGAAGLGLWLTQPVLRAPTTVDAWMAALLGLALAVILPRWLPSHVTRRWLGIDSRQMPRDA